VVAKNFSWTALKTPLGKIFPRIEAGGLPIFAPESSVIPMQI